MKNGETQKIVVSYKDKSWPSYQQNAYWPSRGKSPYIPPYLKITYVPAWNVPTDQWYKKAPKRGQHKTQSFQKFGPNQKLKSTTTFEIG